MTIKINRKETELFVYSYPEEKFLWMVTNSEDQEYVEQTYSFFYNLYEEQEYVVFLTDDVILDISIIKDDKPIHIEVIEDRKKKNYVFESGKVYWLKTDYQVQTDIDKAYYQLLTLLNDNNCDIFITGQNIKNIAVLNTDIKDIKVEDACLKYSQEK